ncbi:MAG: hypothetical protein E7633_10515 [Ruminococcaceae bacterium]|nr:hypothetical protein [Oscillospiraceae bacterium]
MKKHILSLVLILLVFSSIACETTVDEPKTDDESKTDVDNNEHNREEIHIGPWLNRYDIQSFEDYIYSGANDPSAERYFDPKFYIKFDSIIPDSECIQIDNTLSYDGTSRSYGSMYLTCFYGEDAQYLYDSQKSIHSSENPVYEIYDNLNDVPDDTGFFIYNWNGNHILICPYKVEDLEYSRITFIIGKYAFLFETTLPVTSPAQEEFISSFLPSLGATDDSVIAMLDKIKALIPKD